MDRGATWATVHRVPKSRTGLSTVSQVACQDEDGTGFGFKVKVAQWCPTLCDPMGYIQSMEFSRQEYWSG